MRMLSGRVPVWGLFRLSECDFRQGLPEERQETLNALLSCRSSGAHSFRSSGLHGGRRPRYWRISGGNCSDKRNFHSWARFDHLLLFWSRSFANSGRILPISQIHVTRCRGFLSSASSEIRRIVLDTAAECARCRTISSVPLNTHESHQALKES